MEVLDEDIPDSIIGTIPGLQYLIECYIEPTTSSQSIIKEMTKMAKTLAQNSYGLVYNPQTDEMILPTGVKRFKSIEKTERLSVIELTWWLNDNSILNKEKLLEFLNILEKYLPEALPKRYGTYEPPKEKFIDKNTFADFLIENSSSNVWIASNLAQIEFRLPEQIGPSKLGYVNGDGYPDIVVAAYANTAISDTLLVVLDGRGDGAGNGQVLFTIPSAADPTAPRPYAQASVALANFDDDPGLEIVYNTIGGGLRIADNDGIGTVCNTTLYPACSGERHSGASNVVVEGGPVVTDFDHDGMPDVVLRCHALNGHNISDPALDFANVTGCAVDTVVADLDSDGNYEMIDGNHAITVDPSVPGGTAMWTGITTVTAGYIAVADLFASNPGPEVINIRNSVTIRDGATGAILVGTGGSIVNATIAIPGAGLGGAPTVADFDGDGLPEFSTAGTAAYVVYDPDCWDPPLRTGGQCDSGRTDFILWSTPTQDISSSRTGSSVFDFQGDGPAEVLYNDECFLHIFDGLTGSEVVTPTIPSSSRTGSEYPIVADVDGDGNAEIVVISNGDQAITRDHCDVSWKNAGVDINFLCQYTPCTAGVACDGGVGGTCAAAGYMCDSNGICQQPGGFHGIRIYGDAYDRWVRTRPVWTQYSYHVTDFDRINGLWDVPATEIDNWTIYNNYRQNVQGGVLFPAADMVVSLSATPICPEEVRLLATVRNEGSAASSPGLTVDFYRTDVDPPEFIVRETTSQAIFPGTFERVLAIYTGVETDVNMTFSVAINGELVLEECDSNNNTSETAPVLCHGVE
ncbi:hypothetical protein KKD49_16635 [Myxococcota bacterium]|nr:hypothetical protein [Myxococcota bacterium]